MVLLVNKSKKTLKLFLFQGMPRHAIRPQVVDPKTAVPTEVAPPTFQERTESSIHDPPTSSSQPPTQEPTTDSDLAADSKTPKKRKPVSVSQWHKHKRAIAASHPELSAVEQLIMAKKTYTPAGRIRSAQSLHREAFLLRNPSHGLAPGELEKAIRADLIARI